jgi:hypothetical protein
MAAPSLWLGADRRAALSGTDSVGPWLAHLRRTALNGETTAAAASDPGHAAQDGAIDLALRAALSSDSRSASRALAAWRTGLARLDRTEDLGKAHLALASAILFDTASPLWSSAELAAWRSDSLALAASFFRLSPGNPHHITNNWWAVTHSALYCLAAALHASGCHEPVPLAARAIPELEEWAWSRLDAFLGHFGDAGAYHEGLGYQDYTCSYLLPAAILREHRSGENLALRFPGLARMAELFFVSGLEGPFYDDTTGRRAGWGRQLSWNDAGLNWPDTAVPLLALRWAAPEKLPALLARWERLSGHLRPDPQAPARFGARFFTAALHPGSALLGSAGFQPASAPAAPALSLCDRKQGLWLSRDAFAGPADALLGAYARCHQPGGHAQDDAGSFRFSALGWDWVLGGGQARPEAIWQSVVVSSDAPPKAQCGAVLHVSDHVFGMELRRVHAAYGERYLALHPATSAAPLAVAVLDLIDDHRSDRDWSWRLTTSPEHAYAPAADGLGFTLAAPDGAVLEARFLGEPPAALALEHTPGSSRTFANGTTKTYGTRPCVVARFARRPALAIHVVLTLRPAGAAVASPTLIPDAGLSVAWSDTARWHRPFALALPADIPPSRLRSQSAHPAPVSS